MNKKHWENKLALEKEKLATISSEVEAKRKVLEVFIVAASLLNIYIH